MGDRSLKTEPGIQDPAHQDTDKQGTVHLFCDERQPDRHDRRNERPERRVDRRHILFRPVRTERGHREHQDQHHGKHCCPFNIFLHIRHNGLLSPAFGKFHALRFSCSSMFYVTARCLPAAGLFLCNREFPGISWYYEEIPSHQYNSGERGSQHTQLRFFIHPSCGIQPVRHHPRQGDQGFSASS